MQSHLNFAVFKDVIHNSDGNQKDKISLRPSAKDVLSVLFLNICKTNLERINAKILNHKFYGCAVFKPTSK